MWKNVISYTVIDETNKDQYSFWKGALGVALLGGLGAIAGVRGKKKNGIFTATDKYLEFIRCLGIEMAKAIYLDCGPNLSQDIAYILCAYFQSIDNRENKRLHDYNKGN